MIRKTLIYTVNLSVQYIGKYTKRDHDIYVQCTVRYNGKDNHTSQHVPFLYNWHIGIHIAILTKNICTHTAQNLSIILEKILLENYDKCGLISYYLH